MKSLRALKAAGLILAAVVLGLMTVQGSYALWNTTATSNAGTIQAADFNVTAEWLNAKQKVSLDLGTLTPGVPVVQTIRINNQVDAGSSMAVAPKLVATSTGLPNLVPTETEFTEHVIIATGVPGPNGSCTAGSVSGSIPQGTSKTFCVSATLKSSIPAALMGRSFSIPVTLTVSQIPK